MKLSRRRGRAPAAAFLEQLQDRHDLIVAEFLDDGMGYLTALVRCDLRGHRDYEYCNLIEFFGGLLIALGLLTRLVALIATANMVAAQFIAHILEGLIPIQNGGELSLIYIAAFLILIVYGSRRYSIEQLVFDRELV